MPRRTSKEGIQWPWVRRNVGPLCLGIARVFFRNGRALNDMEVWANDGPVSRDIKGRHFRGGEHVEADREGRTNGQRKIDGDGF